MPTANGAGASAVDAPLERMCDRCKTELTAGPAVAAVPASPSYVSASAHQSHSAPPVARSASMSVSGVAFSDMIIEEEPSDLDADACGKQKSDSVSSIASTASFQSQSAATVSAAESTNSATADTQANASASKPKKSGLFSGLVSSIRSAFGADSAADAAKAATAATRPKSASFARAVDDFAAEIIVVPNHGDSDANANANGDRAEMGFDTPIAAVGMSAAGLVAVADNEVLVLAGDSDSDSDSDEDITDASGQTNADETVANGGSAALVGGSQSLAPSQMSSTTSDASASAAEESEAASSSASASSSEGTAIAEVFAKVDFQGDEESANDGSELHFYIGDTIRVTQKVRDSSKKQIKSGYRILFFPLPEFQCVCSSLHCLSLLYHAHRPFLPPANVVYLTHLRTQADGGSVATCERARSVGFRPSTSSSNVSKSK